MGHPSVVIHAVGSKVWVRDKTEAWLKGEVTAVDGEFVTVELEEGEDRRYQAVDCPLQNVDGRPEEVWSLTLEVARTVTWRLRRLRSVGGTVVWSLACTKADPYKRDWVARAVVASWQLQQSRQHESAVVVVNTRRL